MSFAPHAPTTPASEPATAEVPRSQLRRDLRGAAALLVLSLLAGILAASSLAGLLGAIG
jgi:hypothetical protein